MGGPEDGEVAAVESGDGGHAATPRRSAAVMIEPSTKPRPRSALAADELDDLWVVAGGEVDDLEPGVGDEGEKLGLGGGTESTFDQPRRFGDHRRGHRQVTMGPQQIGTVNVAQRGSSRSAALTKMPVSTRITGTSGSVSELAVGELGPFAVDVERPGVA